MTHFVSADEIEQIVGIERHATRHYARAVSAEQTVYILHSKACRDSGGDLRECDFSVALDRGIDEYEWSESEDRPVRLVIFRGRLVPDIEDATTTPLSPAAWECDNYRPPLTCLTAPSSETARCDQCRTRDLTPAAGRNEGGSEPKG